MGKRVPGVLKPQLLGVLLVAWACGEPASGPRFGGETDLWRRMLAAEDGRTWSPAALAALGEGLRSADPDLRRWAVRGLGRLENEAAVPTIVPALADLTATIRAEAANAAGQAVVHGDPGPVRTALLERLPEERGPAVRGVIAETLGRLRHRGPDEVRTTAAVLSDIAGITRNSSGVVDVAAAGAEPTPATWLGVARGFFFLMRQPVARGAIPDVAVNALRTMLTYRVRGATSDINDTAGHVRRLAGAALATSGRITAADIDALLGDDEPVVRVEGATAISRLTDRAAASAFAGRAAADVDPRVRGEAVRALSRMDGSRESCPLLLDAARDVNPHVALLAIDGIGSACVGQPAATVILDSLVRTLPAEPDPDWHRPVHALSALAMLSRVQAEEALPPFAEHGNAFVRAWAARVALPLEDEALLRRLAADASANVRSAAIEGLRTLVGHRADEVFIAQLGEDDSQLLQAAAVALEGGKPAALPALLDAFDRVSAVGRETWRDSRMALLQRIGELGDGAAADRVRPWLSDYDAGIAGLAADVLGEWTGDRPDPTPVPRPRLELPDMADLVALENAEVVIAMADGGRITLRLLPFEAPTNVWRFARLARSGYYDGLTFHRVAPNFVIQGGSPGANEYTGDGPFTRDELGLIGNARGTVGLSTRGRDTGDAQIYINLIDNTRLDHDYTVFAEVVSGMDVVDRVMEGAVMRTVSVRER